MQNQNTPTGPSETESNTPSAEFPVDGECGRCALQIIDLLQRSELPFEKEYNTKCQRTEYVVYVDESRSRCFAFYLPDDMDECEQFLNKLPTIIDRYKKTN